MTSVSDAIGLVVKFVIGGTCRVANNAKSLGFAVSVVRRMMRPSEESCRPIRQAV